MGITQHRHGTANVQQIANLLMLRGNIGRKGAGISPLRGHSNVQGDRTVGITEIPNDGLLDGLARVFGFEPPRHRGHNAIEAIEAIRDGRSKALVCLGGNLAVAKSEPAIIAEIALATLPNTRVSWAELVSDYGKIRDCIEAIFPEFADFNNRIKKPGGFRLYVAASERDWWTPTKRANFIIYPGTD